MPSRMRVKTRFEAEDKMSSTARKIERNTNRMNHGMQKGFKDSRRAALQTMSVLKGFVIGSAINKGMSMLSQGISEVATQFISFDDAITAAAVRFKDIGPESADFAVKLKEIKTAAREAGATTIFTSERSAKALDFLARAGFTSAEAIGSLHSMINLSIATGEDFASVADWSSDLLGAFGLAADNTAQKIANLNRLNDVLVKTANSANVTVENMFETMKDIGPIAAGVLKVSLEDVAAQTAILGNSGIKGTVAMTALKNAYLNLAAPVGNGAEILKAFNVTLKDGKGGVRTLTDVLKELDDKMNARNLDPVDRARIMDAIFGKRAIAGAQNLMANIRNVEEFKRVLDSAAGTSEKTAQRMQQSLGNQLELLKSGFVDLGFEILGGEDKFKSFVDSSIERVNKLAAALRRARQQPEQLTTSQADTRKALELLVKRDISGRGSEAERYGLLSDIANFSSVLIKNKDITELKAEEMIRRLKSETRSLQNREAGTGVKDYFRTENIIFPAAPQSAAPTVNVDVHNNISANGVKVDTTVKAPGGTGTNMGANKF